MKSVDSVTSTQAVSVALLKSVVQAVAQSHSARHAGAGTFDVLNRNRQWRRVLPADPGGKYDAVGVLPVECL